MRDKKTVWLGLAVVALVAAVIGFVALRSKTPEPETDVAKQPVAKALTPTDPKKPSARVSPHQRPAGQRTERVRAGQGAPDSKTATPASQAEEMTEDRIKVIEAWENFIDTLSEKTRAPTAEEAIAFKREFAKLDKRDQMDGIQTALHLLPEEQFPILYPILFDKTIDPDILDEIFSDGLNHDEDIKVPMMKEIYKDKEHPMYVEAARILDATGELDEEGGDAEKE
ncbi:MAG TPA: hypothetical protein PLM82_13615 [Candidatus Latescibacteria bacterium]|nr:hypothetical protein [Candidatus Latescibacterota bacterium]